MDISYVTELTRLNQFFQNFLRRKQRLHKKIEFTEKEKRNKMVISRSTITLQAVLLAGIVNLKNVNGFHTPKCKFSNIMTTTTTRLNSFSYGRGAEIWPATNEDAVLLSDTFPNGIPYSAIVTIEQQDMASLHEVVEESINGTSTIIDDDATRTKTAAGGGGDSSSSTSSAKRPVGTKRKFVSRSIRRILRRAAAKEELDSEGEIVGLDRTPILVAITLLGRGLVRPLDVTLVAFLTAYLTILSMVARRPREGSGAPILPAMPPQGHVPVIVSNPMGVGILTSGLYDAWLKVGVIVGLVGPILLLTRYILIKDNIAAAKICSRPLFLLCCQAISESVSRRIMVRRYCFCVTSRH